MGVQQLRADDQVPWLAKQARSAARTSRNDTRSLALGSPAPGAHGNTVDLLSQQRHRLVEVGEDQMALRQVHCHANPSQPVPLRSNTRSPGVCRPSSS